MFLLQLLLQEMLQESETSKSTSKLASTDQMTVTLLHCFVEFPGI